MKPTIVIDDKIPFIQGVLEPYAQVRYMAGNAISKEHLRHADALVVRTRTSCNAQLLEETSIKLIASATIGYDHIDTAYCDSHNIRWTNAEGCNATSVQQYMLACLLELAHTYNLSLTQKTMGIVGVGSVGSKVADAARLLGMRVLLCDPPRATREGGGGFVSLATVAQEADIVTFHPSLTKTGKYPSYHLADSVFFDSLKSGAIVINTSRGEVVDQQRLKKSLENKQLRAVVLDVWENEPTVDVALLPLLAFATPHIAGYSTDGKANATAMSVEAVASFFNFPLKGWKPQQLPLPANPTITINIDRQPFQDVLRHLVLHTYSIQDDDRRLRLSPESFEQQRGSYPVRREFGSYHVDAIGVTDSQKAVLKQLGFHIL